jgi:hypothetical protein
VSRDVHLSPLTRPCLPRPRLRYRFSPSLIQAGPARAPPPLPDDAGARDALDGTPRLSSPGLALPAPAPAPPRQMPLAGIALAPLLVSPLAPSPRRGSVATAAARRPSALRRARCSAAAASGESGEAGELPRATLLWRAAKLPIYSVALVPLTVSLIRRRAASLM